MIEIVKKEVEKFYTELPKIKKVKNEIEPKIKKEVKYIFTELPKINL